MDQHVARNEKDEAAAAATETKKSSFRKLLDPALWRRWGMMAAVASLIVYGVVVTVYAMRLARAGDVPSMEISLGGFVFEAHDTPHTVLTHGDQISRAEFDLHVGLLTKMDRAARLLLANNRYRLQQSIEELLRRAHGGDFQDPSLTELKRQLQETVNSTLGKRVVRDVIITDLKIDLLAASTAPAPVVQPMSEPASAPVSAPTPDSADAVPAEPAESTAKSIPDAGWREATDG